MEALSESLNGSPELFPFGLDTVNDTVSFIRLSRGDYEHASFLDARILTPHTERRIVPWPQAIAAVEAAGLAEHCAYIFHIGHVGSTLMSRLIGAHARAFALREPMILRAFAQLRGDSAQPIVVEAGAHTPHEAQHARRLVLADQQRAEMGARAGRLGPSADHEPLDVRTLYLEPSATAAGLIGRAQRLFREDPEALLAFSPAKPLL